MNFLNFFYMRAKKLVKGLLITLLPFFVYVLIFLLVIWSEGYSLKDWGINLNPNDYCNLTDIKYTAILHDDPYKGSYLEVTEYLTFDVHAASKHNLYKELWRELPENSVDGLKITYDVHSVSQILENGTEIYYTETEKMYWEDYDFTENSTKYWHHSDGSGRYPDNDESLLIYIPWTYREELTFKIVYTVHDIALKYNDCSELYLTLYDGNTIKKLQSYQADILIPNNIMPSTYNVYTFGTSSDSIPCTESTEKNRGYHTFSIDLDKDDLKFNYTDRYIEFCLLAYGKDKHSFTQYAAPNWYTYEDALDECIEENEYYRDLNIELNPKRKSIIYISIGTALLVVYFTLNKYKKIRNKYNFYEPEMVYDLYTDVPSNLDPFFASQLVFMKNPGNGKKDNNEEYAAILLSLMNKKYVTLTKKDSYPDWEPHSTIITLEPVKTEYRPLQNPTDYLAEPSYITINSVTGEELEPLSPSEKLYYQLLERHLHMYGNSMTLHQFQNSIDNDYEYTKAFVYDIETRTNIDVGVMQGYFEPNVDFKTPQKEFLAHSRLSLFLSIIFLIIHIYTYFSEIGMCHGAFLLLAGVFLWRYLYLEYKSTNLLLFTQFGINEQAKWCGFYNFLQNETFLKELELQDVAMWEKYLIYATAFGISEKVVNAIKIHPIKSNIDDSLILNRRSYIHSRRRRWLSRSFGRSIHVNSRGGGFGGSGYRGGGRRRRRWWRRPLIYKRGVF